MALWDNLFLNYQFYTVMTYSKSSPGFWKRHSLVGDPTGSLYIAEGLRTTLSLLALVDNRFYALVSLLCVNFITVLSRSKHDIWQSFSSRKWEQWITLNIVADCMGSFRHYFKRNARHSCIYATLFQSQINIPSLISGANSKEYKVDTVEPSYYGR